VQPAGLSATCETWQAEAAQAEPDSAYYRAANLENLLFG
jgi:hypothetical protein